VTVAGFDHVHVTEREKAHMSPCGWDDAKWEDCTFMSAVEWWRATGHPDVPATHEEGEHLRCASGREMLGGTNLGDVRVAIRRRYGATTPTPVTGFTKLWAALVPGTVAISQGSMGAFPYRSPWRRWLPGFGGAHAVCIYRPDETLRVWWCDPLAPKGSYSGEWMPKADLKRYVDGLNGGSHLVGRVVPSEEESVQSYKYVYDSTGLPQVARLAFPDPKAMWLRLRDNKLLPVQTGWTDKVGVKARLLEPIIAGKPETDEWMLGWVMGDEAAFVLSRNVTTTPVPVGPSGYVKGVQDERARVRGVLGL
jgi:hypothetical protein